nr:uncharacterized protein LOC101237232 [Hydra vulgaris]
MHLFSRTEYDLSGLKIETVNNLGQATTMLGMLKYSNNLQLAEGLNQLWYKDNAADANLTTNVGFATRQSYIIQKPYNKGTFSFTIPLKFATAAAGKVNLTKVSLWMPYITPSDTERLNLNSVIREKVTIPVAFYSRSCETTTPQQTTKMTWKLGVKSDEKPIILS